MGHWFESSSGSQFITWNMTIRLLVAGICLILSSAIVADTQATSLPPIFNDSWLDLTAGFNEYGFTNDNLKPGFTAEGIQNSNPAFRISLGHNFNRYLALSVSLMRGTDWVHYLDVMPNGGHKKGVWLSLFGLTLKPMLPLGDRFTLYGEAGPGFISRHGFEIYIEPAMQSVIESAFITTPLVGGGFLYRLSEHFLLDWNILYGFPQNGQNQPFTFYTGVGLQYLFGNHDASHYVRSCEFPLNSLQLAYTNNDFFYVDAAPYFSPPSIPIFFTGSIKIENAALLQYERNFYHTAKYFSLEWGLSVGRWREPGGSGCVLYIKRLSRIKILVLASSVYRFLLYLFFSRAYLYFALGGGWSGYVCQSHLSRFYGAGYIGGRG